MKFHYVLGALLCTGLLQINSMGAMEASSSQKVASSVDKFTESVKASSAALKADMALALAAKQQAAASWWQNLNYSINIHPAGIVSNTYNFINNHPFATIGMLIGGIALYNEYCKCYKEYVDLKGSLRDTTTVFFWPATNSATISSPKPITSLRDALKKAEVLGDEYLNQAIKDYYQAKNAESQPNVLKAYNAINACLDGHYLSYYAFVKWFAQRHNPATYYHSLKNYFIPKKAANVPGGNPLAVVRHGNGPLVEEVD